MKHLVRTLPLLLLTAAALAQQAAPPALAPTGLLSDKEARELYTRTVQLMEAGGFALPELARAGAPLIENIRQTVESLEFLGWRNPTLHYKVLTNLRAFLLVSDAVPKPVPFPEASRAQLAELRSNQATVEVYFQALVEQLQRQLREPDRDNLRRYAEANAQLPPPAAGQPRVVFYGDSITDGWRLNEYFPGRDFVNRGISGQITSQMLGRFQADVVTLKPAALIILAGTNDIARGVPPSTIQANFTMMADLADHHGIKIAIASILPVSDYHKDRNPSFERTRQRPPQVINEMNAWLKSFCQRRGYAYVDYFEAMKNAEGLLTTDLADDGLHPNAKGYRVMAPLALAGIEQALTPPKPEQRRRRLF
jgi:lysophospholipase L1-like esterase